MISSDLLKRYIALVARQAFHFSMVNTIVFTHQPVCTRIANVKDNPQVLLAYIGKPRAGYGGTARTRERIFNTVVRFTQNLACAIKGTHNFMVQFIC